MSKTSKIVFSIIGIIAVAAIAYVSALYYNTNKEYKPAGYDYPPISMVSYELAIAPEYEILTSGDNTFAVRYIYLDLTITNNSTKTIRDLRINCMSLCFGLKEDGTGGGISGGGGYDMTHDNIIKEIKGKETVTLRVRLGIIPLEAIELQIVRVDMLAVTYIKFAGFGGEWGDMHARDWETLAPQFKVEAFDYPEFTPIDPPKDIPYY